MEKRKTLSKKTRFEVFKRDGFRCQYCGRSSPDVILEVDHIVPVAQGGKNDIMNLITSCRDCNRGKGKRKITENDIIRKQKAELDALNDKREQMEMMIQWREELMEINDKQIDAVERLIWHLTGEKDGELKPRARNEILQWIKRFGLSEVLTSTELSFRRYYLCYSNPRDSDFSMAFTKIGGVCYNRVKQGDANNGNL